MRTRIKTKGLVSHTSPEGKTVYSKESKCERQLHKLERLLSEGYKIAGIEKKNEPKGDPKKLVIAISGWQALGTITITFKDYLNDYKDKQPVEIVKEIY